MRSVRVLLPLLIAVLVTAVFLQTPWFHVHDSPESHHVGETTIHSHWTDAAGKQHAVEIGDNDTVREIVWFQACGYCSPHAPAGVQAIALVLPPLSVSPVAIVKEHRSHDPPAIGVHPARAPPA